ncbi:MAG: flagellar assembly protein FliW [Clostridium sp.]|jgi:flagellar assembly factor FliW|nr:flagellar assembly protein FliW [Clostridium sp.]
MLLKTKHFDEIEIEEDKIINFKDGIPGFEEVKKYIVLYDGDEASPFRWLQAVDDGQLAFAVADPFMIVNDYDIEIPQEAVDVLEIQSPEHVMILSILVVPEDLSKISMNLKAPVIINTKNKRGMQVVLDTDRYSVRHYIVEELRRREVNISAGSHKKEE